MCSGDLQNSHTEFSPLTFIINFATPTHTLRHFHNIPRSLSYFIYSIRLLITSYLLAILPLKALNGYEIPRKSLLFAKVHCDLRHINSNLPQSNNSQLSQIIKLSLNEDIRNIQFPNLLTIDWQILM